VLAFLREAASALPDLRNENINRLRTFCRSVVGTLPPGYTLSAASSVDGSTLFLSMENPSQALSLDQEI
ncbi:hypothetical protein, partial [Salmonella enterica]|uniref:hypothetical protein n=1 Tax=Salmonella enterica TaxID=28901 RepID=UPI001C0A8E0D